MQTPMKYALAMLAVVALVLPAVHVADATHSQSMNGTYLAGTDCAQTQHVDPITGIKIRCEAQGLGDPTGDATDACTDTNGLFQGTTSTCTHVFSDENSVIYAIDPANNTTVQINFTYNLVMNGIHAEPGQVPWNTVFTGLCEVSPLGVPPNPLAWKAVKDAQKFAADAPGAVTDLTKPNVDANITKDFTSTLSCLRSENGGFTKHASDLDAKVCFYDALGVLLECQTGLGKNKDHSFYSTVLGDLRGVVPVGAASMSVRSAVNTLQVNWWWYPCDDGDARFFPTVSKYSHACLDDSGAFLFGAPVNQTA